MQNGLLEEKIGLYINCQLSAREIDDLWVELVKEEYYLEYLKSITALRNLIRNSTVEKSLKKVAGGLRPVYQQKR